jgi:thiamine-monophosphate kinase
LGVRESQLLDHVFSRSGDLPPGVVVVGPGDDAAVIRTGAELVLLTVDQCVEGVHFRPADPVNRIARKAIARAVSDIAAMGGSPLVALAAATLRRGFDRADGLFDEMHRAALGFGCPLVGGDIAIHDGPTVLSVTVLGRPHARRGPALRSGAKAGDGVYVTGALGGAMASGWTRVSEPRLAAGSALCDTLGNDLHAMMDVSDGLGRDAGRMAAASGVRIEIEARAIPCAEGVRSWRNAAGAGEDYELLFTSSAAPARDAAGTPITRIGRVVKGAGCVILDDRGEPIDAAEMGWEHE